MPELRRQDEIAATRGERHEGPRIPETVRTPGRARDRQKEGEMSYRITAAGERIRRAKIDLYKTLLDAPVEDYEANDVEALAVLACDREVQEILEARKAGG